MDDSIQKHEAFAATMIEDILHDDKTDIHRGEILQEKEREQSVWAAMLCHKMIMAHVLAACFAGGVFGYDSVINGASISMPAFMLYFGAMTPEHSLYVPSVWASMWTAMSYLFQAIGGFGVGFISDRFGRKWSCVGACCISVAGVGIQFAANSRGFLLAGKVVNGLAIGCVLAAATSWASEISPLRLRGPIQSGIVLSTVLMQAIGLVTIRVYVPDLSERAFRLVFAVQWTWPILTMLLFIFMPESPTWLLLNKKDDAARRVLVRLYGSDNHIDLRLAMLRKQVEQERKEAADTGSGGYMELFKGSNLKRTLTVLWLFLAAGLNGASLLSQNVYFLIIAGLPAVHAFDIGIGGFGVAILVIVFSWFYMERVGRRLIWLIGVCVNMLTMAVIGGLFYAHNHASLWAIAILMNVLIAWQILTMTSVGWVICAEISSYRLRAKTQSVGVVSNAAVTWFFTFTVPYMYNTDAGNLGARCGFVFMGSSLLLLLGSYFLVPDLQGFTIAEVDWLYEQKIPVPKFQQYADGRAKEGAGTMSRGSSE